MRAMQSFISIDADVRIQGCATAEGIIVIPNAPRAWGCDTIFPSSPTAPENDQLPDGYQGAKVTFLWGIGAGSMMAGGNGHETDNA